MKTSRLDSMSRQARSTSHWRPLSACSESCGRDAVLFEPLRPLCMGMPPSPEGTGIRRIRDLCREHGVAEPLIDVSESWVTTMFERPTSPVGIRRGAKARVKARVKAEIEGKGHRTTNSIDTPTHSQVQIRDLDRFGPQIRIGPAQSGDSPLDGRQADRIHNSRKTQQSVAEIQTHRSRQESTGRIGRRAIMKPITSHLTKSGFDSLRKSRKCAKYTDGKIVHSHWRNVSFTL